ncbi:MAG: hypothetical protein ACOC1K_04925 [Nanoarchaeota archaeon]
MAPAIYNLFKSKRIHPDSYIVGIGRRQLNDKSFKKYFFQNLSDELKNSDSAIISKLNVIYYKADYTKKNSLDTLKEVLDNTEKNILFSKNDKNNEKISS